MPTGYHLFMQSGARALVMDLGGTGARALLIDGPEKIHTVGPAANPNRVGLDASKDCIVGMLKRLRLSGKRVERAIIGMAGRSHPAAVSIVASAMKEAHVEVDIRWLVNDAELAHLAAFSGQRDPGVLVVAGTGSISVARMGSGQFVRAGGLGPKVGDEGSGHWIGERLFGWARDNPGFREALRKLGVTSLDLLNAAQTPSILAEHIDGLVEGEPLARDLAEQAGLKLGHLAQEAWRKAAIPSRSVKVSGSVLVESRTVRAAFTCALGRLSPPLRDEGDVGDVLETGMAWLLESPLKPVPPGW